MPLHSLRWKDESMLEQVRLESQQVRQAAGDLNAPGGDGDGGGDIAGEHGFEVGFGTGEFEVGIFGRAIVHFADAAADDEGEVLTGVGEFKTDSLDHIGGFIRLQPFRERVDDHLAGQIAQGIQRDRRARARRIAAV